MDNKKIEEKNRDKIFGPPLCESAVIHDGGEARRERRRKSVSSASEASRGDLAITRFVQQPLEASSSHIISYQLFAQEPASAIHSKSEHFIECL